MGDAAPEVGVGGAEEAVAATVAAVAAAAAAAMEDGVTGFPLSSSTCEGRNSTPVQAVENTFGVE